MFYDNFDAVVLDGIMSKAGMVGFSDVLDKDGADDIKAYILHEAAKKQAVENTPAWWLNIKTGFYRLLTDLIGWLASFA